MVSVIIPVYNVKEYFGRCRESIEKQTYRDLEIILVDDASTDGSGVMCDEWAAGDERIKVVHLSKNAGHGEARNAGVDICRGEYLTFLDSDDWWENDYVEKMVKTAVKHDAELVLCDIYYDYMGMECHSEVSEIRLSGNKAYSAKERGNIINIARTFLWGKLYQTSFYKEARIKQPPLGFDDLAVVPYIVSRGERIVRCPHPLYHYLRYRAGNTVDNFRNLYGITDALKILFDYFRANSTYRFFYRELRKLAFSQVRFAMRKVGAQKIAQYTDLRERLFAFMDENFPEWFNPYGKKYAVAGDRKQAEIVKLLLFEDEQLHILREEELGNTSSEYAYVFRHLPTDICSQTQMWDLADELFFYLCEETR